MGIWRDMKTLYTQGTWYYGIYCRTGLVGVFNNRCNLNLYLSIFLLEVKL